MTASQATVQTVKVTVNPETIANDFTMEEIFQVIARKQGQIQTNGAGIAFEIPATAFVNMVRRDLNTSKDNRRVLVGIHRLDYRLVMSRIYNDHRASEYDNDSVIVRADDLVKWMKS